MERKILETTEYSPNCRDYNMYTSPLNFLWKIRDYKITMKEIKLVSTQNKIKGRSKFKTREDYIKAFMKL